MAMAGTAQRYRPAVLSYRFRPFFLAGSAYAVLLIALWVPWFLGFIRVPSALPPVAWHAHELLFGYVSAIVAGFLLTAVPNWTGRQPIAGVPLAGLFGLWCAGRLVVAVSADLPASVVAVVTVAFPVVLAAVVAREIAATRNWRNVKVVVGVAGLAAAQAVFHYEVWRFGQSVYGDLLAIAVTVMLIMIIGGRIVPNFTANWVKRLKPGPAPAPLGSFDAAAMVLAGLALAAWVALSAVPEATTAIGGLLLATAAVHLVRQARWVPHRTLREPLVAVLHAGYLFVPVGFGLAGLAAVTRGEAGANAAVHAWAVGAIGLMTLAVMTRATRGHTGRPLTASRVTVAVYLAIVAAAACRIATAFLPQHTMILLPLAGLCWTLAFLGFLAEYGPMLVRRRADAAP